MCLSGAALLPLFRQTRISYSPPPGKVTEHIHPLGQRVLCPLQIFVAIAIPITVDSTVTGCWTKVRTNSWHSIRSCSYRRGASPGTSQRKLLPAPRRHSMGIHSPRCLGIRDIVATAPRVLDPLKLFSMRLIIRETFCLNLQF